MGKSYKPCKIVGCNGNVSFGGARGMCAKHYQRWKKSGDPHFSKLDREYKGVCVVEGCERQKAARRMCSMHYQRWKLHGDPSVGASSKGRQDWIDANAKYRGEECLPWPYAVCPHGRGVLNYHGTNMSAPKAMCIAAHGQPPTQEHEAAHSCGKGHEGCLNPQHLSWKTRVENEADKVEHGTQRRGSNINTSVLSELQVKDIRQRGFTERPVDIAREFGISASSVCAIIKRKTWAWLD